MELTTGELMNIGKFRGRLHELSPLQLRAAFDALTACVAVMDGATNSATYSHGGANLFDSAAEDFLELRAAVYDEAVKRTVLADEREMYAIRWVILSYQMECDEDDSELIASLIEVSKRINRRPAA